MTVPEGSARLYLDSNVFIDALEGEPQDADAAQEILRLIAKRPLSAFTSELTLAEVLVRPERDRRVDLKEQYLALLDLSSVIGMRPITRDILIESAAYRAATHPGKAGPQETRRNFLPDAIHVVTARAVGATFFVGRDSRLKLPKDMVSIQQTQDGVATLRDLVQ